MQCGERNVSRKFAVTKSAAFMFPTMLNALCEVVPHVLGRSPVCQSGTVWEKTAPMCLVPWLNESSMFEKEMTDVLKGLLIVLDKQNTV